MIIPDSCPACTREGHVVYHLKAGICPNETATARAEALVGEWEAAEGVFGECLAAAPPHWSDPAIWLARARADLVRRIAWALETRS